VLSTILVTVLTSGVVSALVSGAIRLRGERLNRRHEQSSAARDALGELERLYAGVADNTSTAEDILAAETTFKTEVDKCADENLARAADDLVEFGRLYASGDQDSGLEEFQAKVDGIRGTLRGRMKRLN
jgi:hypothetical protein